MNVYPIHALLEVFFSSQLILPYGLTITPPCAYSIAINWIGCLLSGVPLLAELYWSITSGHILNCVGDSWGVDKWHLQKDLGLLFCDPNGNFRVALLPVNIWSFLFLCLSYCLKPWKRMFCHFIWAANEGGIGRNKAWLESSNSTVGRGENVVALDSRTFFCFLTKNLLSDCHRNNCVHQNSQRPALWMYPDTRWHALIFWIYLSQFILSFNPQRIYLSTQLVWQPQGLVLFNFRKFFVFGLKDIHQLWSHSY